MRFSRLKVITVLRVLWIALVLFVETVPFKYSSFQCNWPQLPSVNSQPNKHILFVADPQIPDETSYEDRPFLISLIIRTLVDLNLRKSWRWVALNKQPGTIVFLGDMLDSGRLLTDYNQWYWYLVRFQKIFYMDKTVDRYFIPGNHDIGIGNSELYGMDPKTTDWYKQGFGPVNTWTEIGGHIFVFLDAPSLADEDNRRREKQTSIEDWNADPGGTIEFIHNFSKLKPKNPIILSTHIPLFRPSSASCGPLREKGTLRPGGGVGYENMMGKEVTQFIFSNIAPSMVFSADDHDYCEYLHNPTTGEKVREVTVKSISMVMNVRRPAIHLLTVSPSQAENAAQSFDDTMCILPDQIMLYIVGYVPFALLSIAVLVFEHWPTTRSGVSAIPPPSTSYAPRSLQWRFFLWYVLQDVRDVALFPLGLFILIVFWILFT